MDDRFALVGPGRAGTALSLALVARGWTATAVAGRAPESESTRHAATALGARAVPVGDAGRDADLVIVATPDRKIAEAARALAPSLRTGALVLHLSGARTLHELDDLLLARPDVAVGSLHPLQSLPSGDVGSARLAGSWCAVDGPDSVERLALTLGLPAGPVNVVREDPKNPMLLFAGTDFGVYVSFDGGKAWLKMKGDMPTQPIHDLKIHPREADLIVATHGRGAYIADIKPLQEITPEVLAKDVHLFAVEAKVRWVGRDRRESSSSNFSGESESPGLAISYLLKAKPKEGVKVQVFAGTMLLDEIAGSTEVGLNTVIWNMTGRRERTPDEKKAAQEGARRAREMGFRGATGDPNYASFPVQPGDYRIVLTVDGKSLSTPGTVLRDPRY